VDTQVCYGLDVDKYLSQTTDRQEADSGDFTVWRQLLDRNTGLNIKPNAAIFHPTNCPSPELSRSYTVSTKSSLVSC